MSSKDFYITTFLYEINVIKSLLHLYHLQWMKTRHWSLSYLLTRIGGFCKVFWWHSFHEEKFPNWVDQPNKQICNKKLLEWPPPTHTHTSGNFPKNCRLWSTKSSIRVNPKKSRFWHATHGINLWFGIDSHYINKLLWSYFSCTIGSKRRNYAVFPIK